MAGNRFKQVALAATLLTTSDKYYESLDWSLDINRIALHFLLVGYELVPDENIPQSTINRWRKLKFTFMGYLLIFCAKILFSLAFLPDIDVDQLEKDQTYSFWEYIIGSFFIHLSIPKFVIASPILVSLILCIWAYWELEELRFETDWRIPFYYLTPSFKLSDVWLKLGKAGHKEFHKKSIAIMYFARMYAVIMAGTMMLAFQVLILAAWPGWVPTYLKVTWSVATAPLAFAFASCPVIGVGTYLCIAVFLQIKIEETSRLIAAAIRKPASSMYEVLVQHDNLTAFIGHVNEVMKIFNLMIWIFVTFVVTELVVVWINMRLTLVVEVAICGLIFLGINLLNIFFFYSAYLHGKVMKQHHLFYSLVQIKYDEMNLSDRISLLDALERLHGTFIGFTCHNLFNVTFESYINILKASVENVLLLITLIK